MGKGVSSVFHLLTTFFSKEQNTTESLVQHVKNVSSSALTSDATIDIDRGNATINCTAQQSNRLDWNTTHQSMANCTCQTSWLLVALLGSLLGCWML